jgi:hypothetical protein
MSASALDRAGFGLVGLASHRASFGRQQLTAILAQQQHSNGPRGWHATTAPAAHADGIETIGEHRDKDTGEKGLGAQADGPEVDRARRQAPVAPVERSHDMRQTDRPEESRAAQGAAESGSFEV